MEKQKFYLVAADALPELARRVNRYRARGGLTGTEGADE